ncbi:NfeD family protein [Streptomyces sp. NPDC048566]|uniref:NfeD family protein n=1 Tax=Streptomyces sp. NPDC048566 TaxID=3365569 RepID=UPI003716BFD7
MDPWLIWLVVAAALAVAEIFTLTAALGMLSLAALVTAGSAAIGAPPAVQFLVFTVSAVVSVLFVRPAVLRRASTPPRVRFGVDALVGRSAYVVAEVSARGGRVRIGGEEWTARSYDEALVIPAGSTVDVMEISGATAIVYPQG